MQATAAPGTQYSRTPASVIWAIIAISAVASLFLGWLVYYHQPVDVAGTHCSSCPPSTRC